MLINTKNKLSIDNSILLKQRIYAPTLFKEMVNNYKRLYPNRKIKQALLNSDLSKLIEFVVVVESDTECQIGNSYSKINIILLATRLSPTSLLGYNYLRDYGQELLTDYYHDLNLESIVSAPNIFESFLNSIQEKGLTTCKKKENYFAKPENLPIFFDNISNFKFSFDQARYTKR